MKIKKHSIPIEMTKNKKRIARKIFKTHLSNPKTTRTAFEEGCEKEFLENLSGDRH